MKKKKQKVGQKETMGFRVDPEIRAALEREAKAQDRTISWLINNYIKSGLEQPKSAAVGA